MRESISPMKNVNPSRSTTPIPEFLVRSIPQKKPKAIPINNRNDIIGLPGKSENPICTPNKAPATVGIIEIASNRYVFLKTVFCSRTYVRLS